MKTVKSALLVFLSLAIALPVFRLLSYAQDDDRVHLAAKTAYLSELRAQYGDIAGPNIIVVLLDDLGYGDVGAYGAESIATPNIDALAAGGMRFTHYYSPSSVCSPSRAGLMTGRYPPRTGLGHVVFPEGHPISAVQKILGVNTRIPGEEIMLPEILNAAGYRTGMVGKWHMGDMAPSLPNDFGFDSYYGAHYSNDMMPFDLYRDREVEEPAELDQTRMNDLYTREVVEFIERQKAGAPFFLYYAHNFPHVPLFSSPQQAGKSQAGLYGDVVEDIDRSIGALVDALSRQQLLDNTLIVFTSDNGPWYQGNPGYNRGRKNQSWEGGQRVPFIAHWPARIAAESRQSTPISGVDLMPTVVHLLGLPLPRDRIIDGMDVSTLLFEEGSLAERPLYYFSMQGTSLDAVRDSRFKYHRRRGVRSSGINESMDVLLSRGPWLFDLSQDQQESYDVSDLYPQHSARLQQRLDARVAEMEDNPRGWR